MAVTHVTEEKPDIAFASLGKSPENVWSAVPLHAVTISVWCGVSVTDITGSILFLRS